MTIDLDEAKDRAERRLLLAARHGEALLEALKKAQAEAAAAREVIQRLTGAGPRTSIVVGSHSETIGGVTVTEVELSEETQDALVVGRSKVQP